MIIGRICGQSTGGTADPPDYTSDTDASTYSVPSAWTLTKVEGIVVCFVRSGVASGSPSTPTMSGHSVTWEEISTVTFSGGLKRLTLFAAYAAGFTSDTTDWSFGETQDGFTAEFHQIFGCNESGSLSNALICTTNSGAAATSGSVTFSVSDTIKDRQIACLSITVSATPTASGWNREDFIQGSNPGRTTAVFTRFGSTTSSCAPTWTGSADWAMIGVEMNGDPDMPYWLGALTGNQDKTAGTSITTGGGSVDVAVGDTIYVALGADDGGSAHTCTDNLGNTYTLEKTQTNAGNCVGYLFRSTVTIAGSLTSATASWTTNVTAKAIHAVALRNLGAEAGDDGANSTGSTIPFSSADRSYATQAVLVGMGAREDNADEAGLAFSLGLSVGLSAFSTYYPATVLIGTTGGGSASNISIGMGVMFHYFSNTATSVGGSWSVGGAADSCAAMVYHTTPVRPASQPRYAFVNHQNPGVL